MDAASQRGIDDIREIRERVVLQPVEGRYKVYILDEAHQLTDAAWNALLKLIEEPPPHLVFVFCTTDLAKVLPTVRSRCQTFVFAAAAAARARPHAAADRRRRADRRARRGAGADRARRARLVPRRRSRRSTSSPPRPRGTITVQAVLQLLGAVEEEALFRLCDLIVDRDTAGALVFLEELAEQGQDLGRLVTDLLEHLRHLMLVQHMGEVPGLAARSPTRRASGCGSRRTSSARRPSCGSATCSPSRSTTCARAATRGCRSSSRSSR